MTKINENKRLLIGRIISGFVILFLAFDSITHIIQIPIVIETFAKLGYSADLALPIGVIELVCLILYIIPKTSILGAILLTGYLGGAVASQLRIGAPILGYVMFPVYTGIMVWGGLYLRDKRLSIINPLKKTT